MIWFILWVVFSILVGWYAGKRKLPSPSLACLISLIFSPIIGFIVVAISKPDPKKLDHGGELTKKCPDCAEYIKVEAAKCKHCGRGFNESEIASAETAVKKSMGFFQKDIKNYGAKEWIILAIVVGLLICIFYGFGDSSSNKPIAPLVGVSQPAQTPAAPIDPCSDLQAVKQNAQTINFKELDKNPDSFKDRIARFTGQIVQIQENDSQGIIRLAVTKDSYGWSSSDIIYVTYQNATKFVEDDVVSVYGPMTGSKSYESQANWSITIPSMKACTIEKPTAQTPTPVVKTDKPKTNPVVTTPPSQPITTPTPSLVATTPPQLTVSCSAVQASLTVGQSAIWTAQVSGGTGSYTYSWSGTDGLSGNSQTLTKSYSSVGAKSASVNVTSGDQSVNRSCSNSVTVASNETVGQQNAVLKAKSYLDYSAFSHDGLVAQLEYSQFSHADAVYGADNSGANWNEQALKKAKSYLDSSAFSRDGLVSQLVYSKFSNAEAVYGADNVGANWNEQAAKKAKSYMEYSAFSRGGLIDQLEYSKFTQEQAEYGANSVGL